MPSPDTVSGPVNPQPQAQPPRRPTGDASPGTLSHSPAHQYYSPDHENIDTLLVSGDAALDEFLEGLDFDPELDAESDSDGPLGFDAAAEARKVQTLLEKFQKFAGVDQDSTKRGPSEGKTDDDSGDEEMAKQVKSILAQARDEAELSSTEREKRVGVGEPPDPDTDKDVVTGTPPSNENTQVAGGAAFTLPGVPSKLADPSQEAGDAADDPFSLPTVPSQLVDPADEAPEEEHTRKSLDFENDIVVRLAALRGLGSGVNTDPFGLPTAPTFQPEDRPVKGVAKKPGYTDEDQKTWCIACLEDATIRCLGCDDDVYCARCFRDMHVGPRAGYEERGHKWVKFVR